MPFVSYNVNHGKQAKIYPLQVRASGSLNFISPADITIKFYAVVIMGEGFKINMFEGFPEFHWSVHHTYIEVTKRPCDKVTGYPDSWQWHL